MKNKKIIAFLCALTMIASMFSMLTVSAEGEIGLNVNGSLSEDGKIVTVNVTLSGVDDNMVKSAQVNINVPSAVTSGTQIKAECEGNSSVNYKPNLDGTTVKMNILPGEYEIKDGKLAKITFTLDAPLAENYTAALQEGAALMTTNKGNAKLGTNMAASESLVEKWKDPNQKSEAVVQPPVMEEPEEPQDVTTESDIGLDIVGVASKDNKTVTVNVVLAGVDDNMVKSAQININVPAAVTSGAQIKAECEGNSSVTYKPNLDGTTVKMNILPGEYEIKDGKLAKITFDLGDEALADTYVAALQEGSALMTINKGNAKLGTNMTATSAVVKPTAPDKGKATVANLKDYMGVDKTTGKKADEVAAEAEAAGKTVYMTVEVTKEAENGSRVAAVYGTDYEAVLDGKVLSEAEYNNIIHGQKADGPAISDVIKNLKYNFYSTAKKPQIKTTLNAVGESEQLVNDSEKTDVSPGTNPPTPADKSADGTVKLAKTKVSINSNADKQENTITVTPAKDKDGNVVAGGVLTITVDEDTYDAITASSIVVKYKDASGQTQSVKITDSTTVTLGEAADNKYTVSFTPAAKGTVKYTVEYTDGNGKASTATATYTIKKAVDNDGNGGGTTSSSTGIGSIASGMPNGGMLGEGITLGFTDMDSADWARDAVNSLAMRNIVSGVGNSQFDPNGTLTRAAYAQMLVNAIGKQSEYADVHFDDVATDAWFYHNVAVAAKYGIISGYGDGNFGPYDSITREQMALMTKKAAEVMSKNLAGASVGTFADDADIADWSRDAVYTLADAGIINGMGDGTFAPKANATRAQAAVIIYNAFVK